jgi:hypothetical protein
MYAGDITEYEYVSRRNRETASASSAVITLIRIFGP